MMRRSLSALAVLLLGAALFVLLHRESAPLPPPPPQETGAELSPDSQASGDAKAPSPLPAPGRIVTSLPGIAIHLRRRTPLLSPAPPYGPAYAKLRPAAEGGDTIAQYRLGLMLYECRDVPADERTLERDIDAMYQTRRRGGWDVDDPKYEDATLRRRYEECRDVPEQRAGYREWFKRAADAGLLEAQLDLPLHLPPGEWCQFLAECPPAQRARQQALQQEAIEYLGRARDAGSASALWTFGGWYAEGEVLPRDDIEAYANFRALDEIEQAAGQPRRFGHLLDELRARLRPADLVGAEARAAALLSNPNCCVLTP